MSHHVGFSWARVRRRASKLAFVTRRNLVSLVVAMWIKPAGPRGENESKKEKKKQKRKKERAFVEEIAKSTRKHETGLGKT